MIKIDTELSKKLLLISLIPFIVFSILLYFTRDYVWEKPYGNLYYEDTKIVSCDEQGDYLIVDEAGTRLLKVGADGGLQWEKDVSDGYFSDIRQVFSSQGKIYIHDVCIEEGIRITEESVLECDERGNFVQSLAHYMYTERTLQPHIVGMSPTKDGISYIYKTAEEIRLITPGVGERSFPFENAGTLLHRAEYDEKSDIIYLCTYDGRILRFGNGSLDELYSSRNNKQQTIPWDISFFDGFLYISDIGQRNIICVDTNTDMVSNITENIDFFDREVVYNISALNSLTTSSDYTVRHYLGGSDFEYFDSCKKGFHYILFTVISKIALIVVALLILGYLIFVALFIIKKGNIYMKMISGVVCGAMLLSIIILAVVIPEFRTKMTDAFYARAELASATVRNQVPKKEFISLDRAEDFMGPEYLAVRNVVTSVFFNDSDSMKDLYCSMYKYLDGEIVLSYGLEDNTGAIYPYDWEYEGSNEEMVLTTGKGITYQSSTAEGEYLFTYDPILDENGVAIGIIEVGTDVASFNEELRHLVWDALINTFAVTVVILLIVVELIYFIKGVTEYEEKEKALGAGNVKEIPPEVLRMVSFLVFFLTNLPTAFLPIYAMNVAENVSGLSLAPEIMAALPLSAEVITGAVFSVVGVSIVKKMGEKRSMFVFSLLFIAGFALKIVPNIWMLILGNAVQGIGWGVILLVVNMRITDLPEEQKDLGFSQYNVASLNGINCGVVFGGFLVNWMNYQMVFVVSTILSISMLLITSKYLSHPGKGEEEEETSGGFLETIRFCLNIRVIAVLLLIVTPTTICYYFLNYLYPIVGTGYGLSETYIGYSYLVNGIFVMAFGGALTNFFSKEKRKTIGVVTASLIYAVAFVIVVYLQNIPALFMALALLGISDSFGLPLQSGYYTDLKAVERYGIGPALGIYNLVVNVAQAIGPFVFSYVILVGIGPGLSVVAASLVISGLLFLIIGSLMDGIDNKNKKGKREMKA